MARYNHHEPRYEEPARAPFHDHEHDHSRPHDSISTIAPAYGASRGFDLREPDMTRGAMIRSSRAETVIDEPVIEHEHHHVHHHIDHGDVNSRLAMTRATPSVRPGMAREYSYDDLDVRERRYPNGVTVSTIHETRDHSASERRHRHRHRHRSGRSTDRSQRFSRSDVDLDSYRERGASRSRRGSVYDDYEEEDYTVVDVPAGSKRIQVAVKTADERERLIRERDITWRRENGVRRSRGLGDELWTEITKDMVTREAIEEMGYPFEETDFFYYIFEYLDREQIADLVDMTIDIRKRRVRDIEYESIARDRRTPRMLGGREIEEDTRTEIIVESARGGDRRSRRNRYYNY